MEKNTSGLLVVLVVLGLLVGGVAGALIGYNSAPEKIVTETVTDVVYQNVSVEKIVEVAAPNQLDLAVDAFMQAIEDEEVNDMDYRLKTFDFNEIEISKVYNAYNVSYDDDETTVDFSIRLRFDKDDVQDVKTVYDVTVIFDKDEDTNVSIG